MLNDSSLEELNDFKLRCKQYEQNIQHLQNTQTESQQIHQQEIQQKDNDITELNKQVIQYREFIEKLNKSIEELKSRNQELLTQISSASNVNSPTANADTTTVEVTNDNGNNDYEEEINQLKQSQSDLTQKLEQQNQEIILYKDQIESLNRSIDQYKMMRENIIQSTLSKENSLIETCNDISHYLMILEKKYTKSITTDNNNNSASNTPQLLSSDSHNDSFSSTNNINDDNFSLNSASDLSLLKSPSSVVSQIPLTSLSSILLNISNNVEKIVTLPPLYDAIQFDNINKENINLKKNLKEVQSDRDDYKQQLNSLKISEETSNQTIVELKQIIDDTTHEIEKLKKEKDQIQSEQKKFIKEIKEKKEQISATENRIKSLQKSHTDGMKTIKEINTKLQNRIDEQDEIISQMKNDYKALVNQSSDAKQELCDVQERYDDLERQYNKDIV